MKENVDSIRVFSRRALIVTGIQVGFLGALGGRLAWLQLFQGQKYRVLSDNNRISVRINAPSRGEIVDRFGVPLAVNEKKYRVLFVAEQASDLKQSLNNLATYIKLDQSEIDRVIKKSSKTSKFFPIEVKNHLEWEDVAKIEVNITNLPGMHIDKGENRAYPFGIHASHIVGYVGAVNEKDLEEYKSPVLSLPGYKIGKDSIEKIFNNDLSGQPGSKKVEVNVVGREVRELDHKEGQTGQRIKLTIDSGMQKFLHERISTEASASAVLMDSMSGEIYAMSSHPAYDPNILSRGISNALWQEMLSTPGSMLTNKAIAGQYPPASTFKMVTALAAMRSGHVNTRRKVYCPGHYEYGGNRFHCWKSSGHGSVDVISALQQSCDVYFYEVALDVGIDKIAQVAKELGLGQKLNFDLINEKSGLIPDKAWKLGKLKKQWSPGETIIASIGQGYMLATPLQLAVMTARMVNGGFAVEPHIVEAIGERTRQSKAWPKMNINSEHLKIIQEGMESVVNTKKGTAFGSRINEEQMTMAGKTGTAQVQRITLAQRKAGIKNEDLEWKRRHHALFVGYAPLHNPKYVCSVVVEHGVGGSRTAAPIARDLLHEIQKRNLDQDSNIVPSISKAQ